jgi:hypothetical protein
MPAPGAQLQRATRLSGQSLARVLKLQRGAQDHALIDLACAFMAIYRP